MRNMTLIRTSKAELSTVLKLNAYVHLRMFSNTLDSKNEPIT